MDGTNHYSMMSINKSNGKTL